MSKSLGNVVDPETVINGGKVSTSHAVTSVLLMCHWCKYYVVTNVLDMPLACHVLLMCIYSVTSVLVMLSLVCMYCY